MRQVWLISLTESNSSGSTASSGPSGSATGVVQAEESLDCTYCQREFKLPSAKMPHERQCRKNPANVARAARRAAEEGWLLAFLDVLEQEGMLSYSVGGVAVKPTLTSDGHNVSVLIPGSPVTHLKPSTSTGPPTLP